MIQHYRTHLHSSKAILKQAETPESTNNGSADVVVGVGVNEAGSSTL